MENLNLCLVVNRVVTRGVDWPLYAAVGMGVYWIVDRTVQLPSHMRVGRVVNSAVTWTVLADPPHPGLGLYLAGVP